MMRFEVSFKYLESSEFIENILENNFRKIERRLKLFRRNDPIHISLHLEKNPHKEQYFCRSHIYLPSSKVLVADEKGSNASFAINKSFAALTKQLDKEKHKWETQRRQARQKMRLQDRRR
jgi:ribosomal subunit interface protein